MKRPRLCQLPTAMTIMGRSSSITNAFINAIIPIFPPSDEEVLEALSVLGMSPDSIQCAYCGDPTTEWDHFRPLVTNQKPTGYVTEIANLVPSCGKCNQSKGKSNWREWMIGDAPKSPKTLKKPDLEGRIHRLEAYEMWRKPRWFNFAEIVGPELWASHWKNWDEALAVLKKSQGLASEIKRIIGQSRGS